MWFKKNKKEDEEYPMYEADDYFYEKEYSEPQSENKKKKKRKKKEKINDDYYIEEYQIDEKQGSRKNHIASKILVIIFSYILFIAIGVLSTSFIPNEIGEKEAQIVDIEMRQNRESFNKINAQYVILKNMLININTLDINFMETFGEGESMFSVATKYQDLLPHIDKTLPGAKAMVIDQKYISLKNQIEEIYQDIAIYLQKMGGALSNNDLLAFEEAISWRDKTFYDFEQLRRNLIEFSKLIKVDPVIFTEDLPEIFPLEIQM